MCRDKDYLACHAAPPVLTTKIIKSLNTSFCKVSGKETTEEILGKRAKKNKGDIIALEGIKTAKEKSNKWL